MQFRRVLLPLLLFFLIFSNPYLQAQTFGFGCLGLFGGYGGVVYQSYKADGLNKYIYQFNLDNKNKVENPLKTYDHSIGYRIGVNFFRANWQSGFMITAKGFFQGLSKTNEASKLLNGETMTFSYDLDMKNWAVGVDFGFALTKFINWKIFDGTVNFNNVSLTQTTNMPGETTVVEYNTESSVLGYSISSGLIIDIISNYVSIEGSAGYTYLQIDDLKTEDGTFFLKGNPEALMLQQDYGNLIEAGGFMAVVQLNVGFPL